MTKGQAEQVFIDDRKVDLSTFQIRPLESPPDDRFWTGHAEIVTGRDRIGNDRVESSAGLCLNPDRIVAKLDQSSYRRAWAQDADLVYDPTVQFINGTWYGAWFGEIHQGAKALTPFEGVFVDGFESGDDLGWSDVEP